MIARALYVAASLVPLVLSLLLYTYAIRARLILGHWPAYDMPDPKELGLTTHHDAIFVSFEVVSLYIVAWIIVAALVRHRVPPKNWRIARRVFVIAVSWAIFDFVLDPTGFNEWYAD